MRANQLVALALGVALGVAFGEMRAVTECVCHKHRGMWTQMTTFYPIRERLIELQNGCESEALMATAVTTADLEAEDLLPGSGLSPEKRAQAAYELAVLGQYVVAGEIVDLQGARAIDLDTILHLTMRRRTTRVCMSCGTHAILDATYACPDCAIVPTGDVEEEEPTAWQPARAMRRPTTARAQRWGGR